MSRKSSIPRPPPSWIWLADGTPEGDRRLERVLTCDPGIGVIRHADAGYEEAIQFAREHGIKRPV